MTAYMHDVLDVSSCPPGWRIRCARVLAPDEAGEIGLETLPVVGFATTTSYVVDGSAVDREIVAATLDPEDGAVRPFPEYVVPGFRVARVLAPDEADDAHDQVLVEQLLEERETRTRLGAVAQ